MATPPSVIAVVQARLASTRLPRKVLADLGGRPILAHVIERARVAVPIYAITLTTPDEDAPEIERALRAVPDWQPPYWVPHAPPDLLTAFQKTSTETQAATVVRLTADCPLLDPAIIREAIALQAANDLDYVALLDPPGLDVEVFTARALAWADAEATDPVDREHVGQAVIWALTRRPGWPRWAIRGARDGSPWLAVDTPADLARVRAVHAALVDPTDYSVAAILAAWQRVGRP